VGKADNVRTKSTHPPHKMVRWGPPKTTNSAPWNTQSATTDVKRKWEKLKKKKNRAIIKCGTTGGEGFSRKKTKGIKPRLFAPEQRAGVVRYKPKAQKEKKYHGGLKSTREKKLVGNTTRNPAGGGGRKKNRRKGKKKKGGRGAK